MNSFHQGLILPWLAGISSVLFAVLFVSFLYLFPLPAHATKAPSSPSPQHIYQIQRPLDRDHPLVIQQRIKGILLTMIVVPVYLWIVFTSTGVFPVDMSLWTRMGHFFRLLGLTIPATNPIKALNHIVLPVLLVAILFLGPLMMQFLDRELPFQARFHWSVQRRYLTSWIGIRNYIVGPIAEEFIFRACMVAVVSYSGASIRSMVFGLPMVFGIAHLHHAYGTFVKNGRTRQALIQAGLIALVQLTYTTLFGWFATFLFLRTSSLLGPSLSHSFCNLMGFPDVSSIEGHGSWKKWVYVGFILGMVFFGVLVGPMTSPGLYGDESSCAYWSIAVR
ncbi:hypothetical protein BC939DRAFT_218661 [Gamsiella multidivaricata]|uniref:uncharacterized protein n=1 Tax=Gamsiella multidivaricata TaxID=101098 RepID=UPI00221F4912|nr:uncharacterized protein BC939DRAFT_218661 [Gamsiella multidivaricata]KAI7820851.1 hypothetical protein BC939DRAFT_218661 [Gamsiella multidivaricata]